MAMTICGFYNVTNSDDSNVKAHSGNFDKTALGLADLVTLFLEMIDTYILINENNEASKLMQVKMQLKP